LTLYKLCSGKPFQFKDLVERLWEGIDTIFNAKAELDSKTLPKCILRGWELMQIVREEQNLRPKEAKVQSLWPKLSSDENIVVLFRQDLGQAIIPYSAEGPHSIVPNDKFYLAASVPSLKQLSTRKANKETCSQLTEGMYWVQPNSLFSNKCKHEPGETCRRVQKLTAKPSRDERTKNSPSILPQEGCIVFGEYSKTVKKPPPASTEP
jgi:hypothetical protein